MKLILSHPTANAFVRGAAAGFEKAGILSEFYTAVASFEGDILDRLGYFKPFAEIRRRRFNRSLKPFIRTKPLLECGRQISLKYGLKKFIKHETGIYSMDAVYRDLDHHVASRLTRKSLQGVNGIYAYEDGALSSFRQAKKCAMQCFYDLPIGYWRASKKFLEVERDRWPEWSSTLTGLEDSSVKLGFKDEEIQLADRIFVASSFTAKTLEAYPGVLPPIDIIPYAFPSAIEKRTYHSAHLNRKIKILFVGGLSQRKGIADLIHAVKPISNYVELTIVGKKSVEDCPALNAALNDHKWIPSLPHHEILALMQANDILVFPSLFEGFGLVITEAMSQGTPVITTDRTAGPDIISNDQNGWLINAGSTEDLQNAIIRLIEKPDSIASVGKEALETARKRTWHHYEQELVQSIFNHYNSNIEAL